MTEDVGNGPNTNTGVDNPSKLQIFNLLLTRHSIEQTKIWIDEKVLLTLKGTSFNCNIGP